MCLFFSFPSLLLRSSSTLKSKLERLWSVPSFKDIAMRTDLLDSNYLHKDGVLRVSSQSTYYPSFYKKKYSAARGLLFIFRWCPFYFARLIGFLFSFLWFVHVLVIVFEKVTHWHLIWTQKLFFICFHAVFFLYIINSADIFYTPTTTSLWSKMNPYLLIMLELFPRYFYIEIVHRNPILNTSQYLLFFQSTITKRIFPHCMINVDMIKFKCTP